MGIRTANGFKAMMARQIERAIINCGNPFIEDYLESIDTGVANELEALRSLQAQIAREPDTDKTVASSVLDKWLYGWKDADKALACMILRTSDQWCKGLQAAQRAVIERSVDCA
jgi:hypothetical protein